VKIEGAGTARYGADNSLDGPINQHKESSSQFSTRRYNDRGEKSSVYRIAKNMVGSSSEHAQSKPQPKDGPQKSSDVLYKDGLYPEHEQAYRFKQEHMGSHITSESTSCKVTWFEKIWLQCGWLLVFFVMMTTMSFLLGFGPFRVEVCPHIGKQDVDTTSTNRRETNDESYIGALAAMLHGDGVQRTILDCFVVSLAFLNFVIFAYTTTLRHPHSRYDVDRHVDDSTLRIHAWLEVISLAVLGFILLLRVVSSAAGKYPKVTCLRYFFSDTFAKFDFMAINLCLINYAWLAFCDKYVPEGCTLCQNRAHINFLGMSAARIFQILPRMGMNIGVQALTALSDD